MIYSNSFSSRLRKSGLTRTVATAAVAASSALVTANAAVIYSGVVNTAPALNNTGPVNVDNIGSVEFTLRNTNPGKGVILDLSPLSSDFMFVATNTSTNIVSRLALGVNVDMTGIFSPGQQSRGVVYAQSGFGTTQWQPSDVGYMAFLFNPTGLQPLYGWAQFSISANAQTMTLIDYAYENSGSPIKTGAIPEPGTVTMGAIGAGLFFFVRRRKAS